MRTRRVRTGINHFCTTQKSLCAHSTERQESTVRQESTGMQSQRLPVISILQEERCAAVRIYR